MAARLERASVSGFGDEKRRDAHALRDEISETKIPAAYRPVKRHRGGGGSQAIQLTLSQAGCVSPSSDTTAAWQCFVW